MDSKQYVCLGCGEVFQDVRPDGTCWCCGAGCLPCHDYDAVILPPLSEKNISLVEKAKQELVAGHYRDAFLLTASVSEPSAEAMYINGQSIRFGNFADTDVKDAILSLSIAVRVGSPDAVYALYEIFRDGSIVPANLNTARIMLRLASERGYKKARLEYAKCLLNGKLGVTVNEAEAFSLFKGLDSLAYYWIGHCYMDGLGVEKNHKQALKYFDCDYFESYANGRDSDTARTSAFFAGLLYFMGEDGVEKNLNFAEQRLSFALNTPSDAEEAVCDGSIKLILGSVFAEQKAYADAVGLLTDSDVLSDPDFAGEAQKVLGTIYSNGSVDVPQDIEKAYGLLKAAYEADAEDVIDEIVSLKVIISINQQDVNKYKDVLSGIDSIIEDRVQKLFQSKEWNAAVKLARQTNLDNPAILTSLGECSLAGKGTAKDISKAVELFDKAVGYGSGMAAYKLYELFSNGGDIQADEAKALEYLKRAESLKSPLALSEIGCLYEAGKMGFPQDIQKAVDYYTQAGAAGCFRLGNCHLRGTGVLKNVDDAIECFERGAAAGMRECSLALGNLYAFGDGVPVDVRKARSFFDGICIAEPRDGIHDEARFGAGYCEFMLGRYDLAVAFLNVDASKGFRNDEADYCLGRMYLSGGKDFPSDSIKAISHFESAAKHGNFKALASLRDIYQNGAVGIPSDNKKADESEKRLCDAALASFAAGSADEGMRIGELTRMDNIALLLKMGLSCLEKKIVRDWGTRAEEFLGKAASKGSPDAAWNLYLMFHERNDVPHDDEKAAAFLRQAAAKGHAEAMVRLADFLKEGECGMEADAEEAARWYAKAGAKGVYSLAKCYLAGYGVQKDVRQAIETLKRAASSGDAACARLLGKIYMDDSYGVVELDKAIEWFRVAADAGCADLAEVNLDIGVCLHRLGKLKDAVDVLTRKDVIESGLAGVYLHLGEIYRDGDPNVKRDGAFAVKYFDKALEVGADCASAALRDIYAAGELVAKDLAKAAAYEDKLEKAVARKLSAGDVSTAVELSELVKDAKSSLFYSVGKACLDGRNGLTTDRQKAVEFFEKASACGSLDAKWQLHLMLEAGDGISKDIERATVLLRETAEAGYAVAQKKMGEGCLADGDGGSLKGYRDAVEWFRKAGEVALLDLAGCYRDGKGVYVDIKEAAKLYERAAVSADEEMRTAAALALGDIYMNGGEGLTADFKVALKWFDAPILPEGEKEREVRFNRAYCNFKLGNYRDARDRFSEPDIISDPRFSAVANRCLGVISRDGGDGLARAPDSARKFLDEAILQGDSLAKYELGVMYSRALGCERDMAKAKSLYEEAANSGCEIARKALEEIAAEESDDVGIKSIVEDGGNNVPAGPLAMSRADVWAQKLLDISLDNKLINASEGSRVQFIPEADSEWFDLQKVETWLEDDKSILISPIERKSKKGKFKEYEEDNLREKADKLFEAGQLCVVGKLRANQTSIGKVFAKKFDTLLKDSTFDSEGEGTHTLYMALGFLEWKDDEGAKHLAPIVLSPIRMEPPNEDGVYIRKFDDDVQVNYTLLQFIQQKYRVRIPMPDPLPRNAQGITDIRNVLGRVKGALEKMGSEFRIIQTAAIGCFSFGSFAMWRDIKEHPQVMSGQPFVRYLMHGGGVFLDENSSATEDSVRRELTVKKPEELLCPLSADSSQLSAVLLSEKGRSFVIEGPPGTGKSQTIVNLIAHNMALGKRVLFVAKKDCALSVVKDRLDSVGLAPFCLELHADKKERSKVSKQFMTSFAVNKEISAGKWQEELDELHRYRASLAGYVEELHKTYPNGLSAYDCIVRGIENGTTARPELIGWVCTEESSDSLEKRKKTLLDTFSGFVSSTDQATLEFFRPFKKLEMTPSEERKYISALQAVVSGDAEKLTDAKALLSGYFPDSVLSCGDDDYCDFCKKAYQKADEMPLVAEYLPLREKAVAAGLDKFIALFESGIISDRKELAVAFDSAYNAKMYEEIEDSPVGPSIYKIAGRTRDLRMKTYRSLVNRCRAYVEQAVVNRIANLPDYPDFSQKLPDDLDLMQSEICAQAKKTRGHSPVRKLLDDNAKLVYACKRCFLMSPESVAKFLPMKNNLFDLVIFDEASQIEVCEAVGAMARCKQIIVVGDQKQMPPSQKVGAIRAGSENFIDKDAESILAECEPPLTSDVSGGALNVRLPSIMLSWHYRSRHESLIEFSNRKYYDSGLHTFPSALNSSDVGLGWVWVDGGVMENGRNVEEARKIAGYIRAVLTDKDYAKNPRSIGVVAFNAKQKTLLDQVIRIEARDDPDFAEVKDGIVLEDPEGRVGEDDNNSEPRRVGGLKFVSNLENVQGDEADIIIFSITYTPSQSGRVTRNLGRLTEIGGERRLNVAVTRAREQMLVFSSMHGYQMEAKEDEDKQGFIDLSKFLTFAEKYHKHLAKGQAGHRGDAFVQSVADYISSLDYVKKHGLEIRTGIGSSKYKIDIAIVDPRCPDKYLLGIECDGKAYASQLTVEDRDVLRANQLTAGGWNICRVWSAEWFHHRRTAEKDLRSIIEEIKVPEPVAAAETSAKYLSPASEPSETLVKAIAVEQDNIDAADVDEIGAEDSEKNQETVGDSPASPTLTMPKVDASEPLKGDGSTVNQSTEPPNIPPSPVEVAPSKAPKKVSATPAPTISNKQPVPEAELSSSPSNCYPLPTDASSPVYGMKPSAVWYKGVKIRNVKGWADAFLAICEKLNEVDAAKFQSAPSSPKLKLVVKLKKDAPRGEFIQAKFGTNKDVCVSKLITRSSFLPKRPVSNILEFFGVDSSQFLIQA